MFQRQPTITLSKMKFYGLVLTLLACVTAAVSQSHSQCCVKDKQFLVGLGGSIGELSSGMSIGIEFAYELAADITGRQTGGEGFINVLGSGNFTVKFIQVWSEKKQYTIVNGNCTVTPLTAEGPSACTPKSAQFVATLKQGKDEFTTQTWSLKPSDVGLKDGVAYLSVSDSTCVPVGVAFMGISEDLVSSHMSAGYFNFSSGIPDPKRWFDIPSSCQHQKLGALKSGPLEVMDILSVVHSLIF